MTTPSREEAPERVLLERFGDEVSDVHSRIIIVHQLRASAEIQDHQTKRETGWADTDDRATLMRKAADVIEALANREPSEGDVERVARAIGKPLANMTGGCFKPDNGRSDRGDCADGDCYCARVARHCARAAYAEIQAMEKQP